MSSNQADRDMHYSSLGADPDTPGSLLDAKLEILDNKINEIKTELNIIRVNMEQENFKRDAEEQKHAKDILEIKSSINEINGKICSNKKERQEYKQEIKKLNNSFTSLENHVIGLTEKIKELFSKENIPNSNNNDDLISINKLNIKYADLNDRLNIIDLKTESNHATVINCIKDIKEDFSTYKGSVNNQLKVLEENTQHLESKCEINTANIKSIIDDRAAKRVP